MNGERDMANALDRLDEYLDDLLDASAKRAFEEELASNPILAEALALQERLDESIGRVHQAPSADQSWTRIQSGLVGSVPAKRAMTSAAVWARRLAIAASVVISTIALWRVWAFLGEDDSSSLAPMTYARVTFDQAYSMAAARDFAPEWVCKDDREFAMTFFQRLEQGLLLKPMPKGLVVTGMNYANCISEDTIYLTGKIETAGALVIIDRSDREADTSLPVDSDLNVFSRKVGPLSLYEVTPLDEPHFLDLLYAFEIPSEWLILPETPSRG